MEYQYRYLAEIFSALAHPVRLHILDMLRNGEMCVCEIEAAVNKRQAYVSQQLMVLRESGLVEACKRGLQVHYRLTDPMVERLLQLALKPESIVDGSCCEQAPITAVQEVSC